MKTVKTADKRELSVAIILLNYNSYDYTVDCVESLKQITYSNYQIIVVDNNSPDNSYERLLSLESPGIHIIESGKNGGFAFGNNIGIEYANTLNCDYILLLNNDTLVTEDFLTCLVDAAQRENADITSSRIMYNDHRDIIWYAGGEIDWFNRRATHYGVNTTKITGPEIREVTFVSGCCMLLSKKCIDTIGGLPEDYFMYYEDMDYCRNAVLHDLKLLYVRDSVIYHCVSASGGGDNSPFVIEWSNRARRLFIKKYGKQISMPKKIFGGLCCELRCFLRILKSGNIARGWKAYLKSFHIETPSVN